MPLAKINKAQQKAIKAKADQARACYTGERYQDQNDGNYRHLRRKAQLGWGGEVMLFWCNMWLGIEPDGYTHS